MEHPKVELGKKLYISSTGLRNACNVEFGYDKDAFLYSITNKKSYDNIKKWIKIFYESLDEKEFENKIKEFEYELNDYFERVVNE